MLLSTPLRLVADGLRQFHAPCEDDQSQFIDLAKITIIVLHGVMSGGNWMRGKRFWRFFKDARCFSLTASIASCFMILLCGIPLVRTVFGTHQPFFRISDPRNRLRSNFLQFCIDSRWLTSIFRYKFWNSAATRLYFLAAL
jgi:hypothetical protein